MLLEAIPISGMQPPPILLPLQAERAMLEKGENKEVGESNDCRRAVTVTVTKHSFRTLSHRPHTLRFVRDINIHNEAHFRYHLV